VVEHLEDIQASLSEISRTLKPGGKILILTTNIWSPFIFIPFLLPFRLKRFLLKKVYKVEEDKILPTYHRLNSLKKFKERKCELRLIQLKFIQDANYVRKWIFMIFFVWHIITKPKFLKVFRTNIIAVYEK
jgi:ubiquinone/menaquinone biosynthesis C-methylase UbiE